MKNRRFIRLGNVKNKFRLLFVGIIILQSLLLTSCIKTTELKEKAIIQAIGIDRHEGKYNVIIQNFRAEGSGKIAFDPSQPNNFIVEDEGITIGQALKFIRIHHGKDVFLGNNNIIVVGRKTAEEGMMDVFNFFNSSYECRPNTSVVMAGGLASDVIKAQVMDGPTPAIVLERVIEQYKNTGIIDSVDLNDVIERLKTEGAEAHLPIVNVSMDLTNRPQFDIKKTAIFSGDKLVGELNRGQTRGLRWFNDTLTRTNIVVEDSDLSKFFVPISKSNTKIKVKIVDDIPHFEIKTKLKGSLLESIFPDKYGASMQDVERVEILCNEKVESEIFSALSYTLREKKADALGVSKYIKQRCPDYWKKNSDNWDEIMSQVVFDIKAETKMDTVGLDVKR